MSVNMPAPWSMWVIWRWMCPKSSKVVDHFSYGNSCGDSSIESQGGLVQNWWAQIHFHCHHWLVVWNMAFIFHNIWDNIFHILGMSSSQLTIFQRGRSTTNQGKMMVVNQWLWGTCSDKAVFAYTFTYFYRVYFLWRKVSIWSDRKTALVAEICHGCRWGRQLLL